MTSFIFFAIADVALGAMAWRLGKKNEQSNQNMERAITEMAKAVTEMKIMNESIIKRLDKIEEHLYERKN